MTLIKISVPNSIEPEDVEKLADTFHGALEFKAADDHGCLWQMELPDNQLSAFSEKAQKVGINVLAL